MAKFCTASEALHRVLILITTLSTYTEAQLSTAQLYDFGLNVGDSIVPINDDGSTSLLYLNTSFPFFDTRHSSLYVNTNGVVSFLVRVSQYTPNSFPLGDSRKVIAVFWADVDTTRNDGRVYYRETTDDSLLNEVSLEIRNAFITHDTFTATWAFIVTWRNVTYFGGGWNTPINTFQMALLTNTKHSFVIFNYANITWTTGTASGGSSSTGLGGTPAQAGFNAGDGVRYFNVPGSQTSEIVDVELTSNVDVPGKWIFRVDDSKVTAGGCRQEQGSLLVSPSFAGMFGGTEVLISGPCYQPHSVIKCRFKDTVVRGFYVDTLKVKCYTPLMTSSGRLTLYLSVDGGASYNHSTTFTIVYDQSQAPDIERVDHSAWDKDGPYRLKWEKTLTNSSKVDVHLMGFGESSNDLQFELVPVYQNLDNTGETALSPELQNFVESDASASFSATSGVLRITPAGSSNTPLSVYAYSDVAIWSDPHSPQWYHRYVLTRAVIQSAQGRKRRSITNWIDGAYQSAVSWTDKVFEDAGAAAEWVYVWSLVKNQGPHIAKEYCQAWFAQDSQRSLPDDLPPCPCTFRQARAAVEYTADPACNNGNGCTYHPGAFHCVRSVTCSSSGAGQQCCYNHDGELMNAGDDLGGGTLDTAHYKGCNGVKKKVIGLSHFAEDVVPYYYCCQWSEDKGLCKKTYMSRRPSTDCSKFNPPRPAGAWGDPHITTLDGFSYTFNGLGEYVVVIVVDGAVTDFMVQGRTSMATDDNGLYTSATIWSAIAIEGKSSDKVQVEVNDIRVVDVLVNGTRIDFTDITTQEFNDVTVDHNESSSKVFIVMPLDGVSIDIRVVEGAINFMLFLSSSFKGKTSGLFGSWNDDSSDDLMTRNGGQVSTTSSASDIHYNFGETWRTTSSESIFTYQPGTSHSTYQHSGFTPNFTASNSNEAVSLCGSNADCLFDYSITGKTALALGSKTAVESYSVAVEDTVKVVACSFLEAPTNGSKNGTKYTEGSIVHFSCNEGYHLHGSASRVCQQNGLWSGEDAECLSQTTQAETTTTTSTTSTTTATTSHFITYITDTTPNPDQGNSKPSDDDEINPDWKLVGIVLASSIGGLLLSSLLVSVLIWKIIKMSEANAVQPLDLTNDPDGDHISK